MSNISEFKFPPPPVQSDVARFTYQELRTEASLCRKYEVTILYGNAQSLLVDYGLSNPLFSKDPDNPTGIRIEELNDVRNACHTCQEGQWALMSEAVARLTQPTREIPELRYYIRDLLSPFNRLGAGVESGIMDFRLVNDVEGRYIVAVWHRWSWYVHLIQTEFGSGCEYAFMPFARLVLRIATLRMKGNAPLHTRDQDEWREFWERAAVTSEEAVHRGMSTELA